MSAAAKARLLKDLQKITSDPNCGVSAAPCENNVMIWNASVLGPPNSPYEEGFFHLRLQFTDEYPYKPPKIKFLTKMFHPNIYSDGAICLDILNNKWSSVYDVNSVLTSIQSLLDEPNAASPANAKAAKLFVESRSEFNRIVRKTVEESWDFNPQNPPKLMYLVDQKHTIILYYVRFCQSSPPVG
ncbi:Ubiquitin-conjugating enzyme E2 A [Thelohanellus kitauei]|uniref:Ubiquitin-conjugating enzyme E2 A n=1 Tax=Thelohanellus kitauei TaxID=669202 RepID=A0A0C2IY10_THEKT|nr:Ubiquitin-conjugating enzyme E2 A [Thelohanellus kitauei]